MLERPPLSLYIHIPWCEHKCPYCDFNSHEASSPLPESEYVNALLEDFKYEYSRLEDLDVELISIFIGGGTPSLFSGESYKYLLQEINLKLPFSNKIEITLEVNPGTAEAGRFISYREAGINRLSIGVQSFDNNCLKQLERIHSAEQAFNAIKTATSAGFTNFNIDLMHGLPSQTIDQALNDLQNVIDRRPTHISWYQLTIEPNTKFYRKTPILPVEPVLKNIQDEGHKLLESSGYKQYEVSAYATETYASIHNKNYWSFGDYLGIGAGAHGKLSLISEAKLIRTRKLRRPDHYTSALNDRTAELIEIPSGQIALEFLMNALRLKDGFSRRQFETRTGLSLDEITKGVESLVNRGLMQRTSVEGQLFISTTPKGYLFLNNVIGEFL